MADNESNSSTTGTVEYNGLLRFPKYMFLMEHDLVKTVIRLPDMESLAEVEHLCMMAIAECNHGGLGPCLAIKQATIDDWLEWH